MRTFFSPEKQRALNRTGAVVLTGCAGEGRQEAQKDRDKIRSPIGIGMGHTGNYFVASTTLNLL